MLVKLTDFVDLFATLFKKILSSEDSSVSLHGFLHSKSDLGSWFRSLGISQLIKVGDSLLTGTLGELFLSLTRLESFSCGVGCSSSKNDEIKK